MESPKKEAPPERAAFFVDGNNWFKNLNKAGVFNLGQLNYLKVSQKLLDGRIWAGTKYCIGRVKNTGNPDLYNEQQRYLGWLANRDKRLTIHFGRIEERIADNDMAKDLKAFLSNLSVRGIKIDLGVYKSLWAIAERHEHPRVYVEKAVDVMIAVSMVEMAQRNLYDIAFLLSADGDYTPAVVAVKSKGKRVIAVAPSHGGALARVVDEYMHLKKEWFEDCFGD